jgi:uncharacterized protein (DUF952 family)
VRKIYKICSASAWREAERQGVYRGSADDLRDGFIHFSTAAQVAETARRHFFGQKGLFLVEVDGDALGAGSARAMASCSRTSTANSISAPWSA